MEDLLEKLVSYSRSEMYPFHMPGHKRNMGDFYLNRAYQVDITEIEGFDNLYQADGILKAAMERAAKLYQSEETHFLVNGSTAGILSGISGCVKKGGKLLMARNSHKAAYHAVYLREITPVYLYPLQEENFGIAGSIAPEDVKRALEENPDIEAVFLTSPTYDGVLSDISAIGKITHERGIPLIVDEAHGAHLGFHKAFPRNAIQHGADIVIHSIHKTLPSFTQTALLHENGTLVHREKVNQFLQIYQSSSPSYLLMAGMDTCITMIREQGAELFEKLRQRIGEWQEACKELRHLKIYSPENRDKEKVAAFDFSKLLISTRETGRTGKELHDLLRNKYHLQMEMYMPSYVVGIGSVMDTREGFERLAEALREIDASPFCESCETCEKEKWKNVTKDCRIEEQNFPLRVYPLSKALDMEMKEVVFENAAGKISGEYLYLYPPGIPLVVPGEVLQEEMLHRINAYRKAGYQVLGAQDSSLEKIKVIC